jgi:putative photosynthetic complex assembly protein 2
MAAYLAPCVFAAFVWWFATGAVLLLVGLPSRYGALKLVVTLGLIGGAIGGLTFSAAETSVTAAFTAFSSTLLLWAAQEIAFLAGWLTGPRAAGCPREASGIRRLGYALQAILYHEFSLIACGIAVAAICWRAPNQVALWTFASLWVLRQSAKINLFVGVPVTNHEMMPAQVQFLKSYFSRRPVGAFFALSVSFATMVLLLLILRLIDPGATPFEIAGLSLVSTLFALGIVEHWFMLLPLPAITLWGWGLRSASKPETLTMDQPPPAKTSFIEAHAALSPHPADASAAGDKGLARQRLEDQFRRTFLEQRARADLSTALSPGIEPAVTLNGRTS